jgi:ribosomal protein S6--L-glutamate ligase
MWISFNPYRTIGMKNVNYIKPEHKFEHKEEIRASEWLLYPEYWQVNSLVYELKNKFSRLLIRIISAITKLR